MRELYRTSNYYYSCRTNAAKFDPKTTRNRKTISYRITHRANGLQKKTPIPVDEVYKTLSVAHNIIYYYYAEFYRTSFAAQNRVLVETYYNYTVDISFRPYGISRDTPRGYFYYFTILFLRMQRYRQVGTRQVSILILGHFFQLRINPKTLYVFATRYHFKGFANNERFSILIEKNILRFSPISQHDYIGLQYFPTYIEARNHCAPSPALVLYVPTYTVCRDNDSTGK